MKHLFIACILLFNSIDNIYAQSEKLFLSPNNYWGTFRPNYQWSGGSYLIYKSDSLLHEIDSNYYTKISNLTQQEYEGYYRFDTATGVLYFRSIDGSVSNEVSSFPQNIDIPVMREDAQVGDTIELTSSLKFIVTNIYYTQLPNFLGFDNLNIDSVKFYQLYIVGSFVLIDYTFNFVTGFSTGPFPGLGFNNLHTSPRLQCFWNEQYSDTTAMDCFEYGQYLIRISTNNISYKKINAYPNPTTQYINISLNDYRFDNAHIIIRDVLGVVKKEIKFSEKEKTIDVYSLPSAVYTIEVRLDNNSIGLTKFLKI